LFAVAGRLTSSGRRLRLRLAGRWPWAAAIKALPPGGRPCHPADQPEQPPPSGRRNHQGPWSPGATASTRAYPPSICVSRPSS